MSVAKIEEIYDMDFPPNERNSPSLTQCCDRHVLVSSRIPVNFSDGVSYVDLLDINSSIELPQLRSSLKDKNALILTLERENTFLKEQVRSLNNLLDQLSITARNQATKNDIRIKVENTSSLSFKKWYRRPKVVLTGSAMTVLFSIYLRYKIKNW